MSTTINFWESWKTLIDTMFYLQSCVKKLLCGLDNRIYIVFMRLYFLTSGIVRALHSLRCFANRVAF